MYKIDVLYIDLENWGSWKRLHSKGHNSASNCIERDVTLPLKLPGLKPCNRATDCAISACWIILVNNNLFMCDIKIWLKLQFEIKLYHLLIVWYPFHSISGFGMNVEITFLKMLINSAACFYHFMCNYGNCNGHK